MGTSFPPLPYSLLLSLTNDPFFFTYIITRMQSLLAMTRLSYLASD